MITAAIQFADSSSGLGALGLDVKALIIQLVTFVISFWILKRFAFTPIINMMEKRRKTIEDGVSLGEKMKQDEAAMQTKVATELAKARTQADSIVASAEESSRQIVRDAEGKASEKAAVIVREGEARAAQEMDRARKALESEVVALISDATETIIGEKVDAKKDAQLIDRALKGQRI